MAFSLSLPRSSASARAEAKPAIVSRIARAMALHRQRRQLAALDSAALRDMGLTPADVAREARRSVWNAPEGWRG
ncbi:DUF1127 domain-containing protein [Litorivita sp. NS0012-18]|uniref:DUF1127 domain-containing protein n=1 Tax=Litorivita sp. NS0012-18 TaxID=3127655 RepID=UPI003103B712